MKKVVTLAILLIGTSGGLQGMDTLFAKAREIGKKAVAGSREIGKKAVAGFRKASGKIVKTVEQSVGPIGTIATTGEQKVQAIQSNLNSLRIAIQAQNIKQALNLLSTILQDSDMIIKPSGQIVGALANLSDKHTPQIQKASNIITEIGNVLGTAGSEIQNLASGL